MAVECTAHCDRCDRCWASLEAKRAHYQRSACTNPAPAFDIFRVLPGGMCDQRIGERDIWSLKPPRKTMIAPGRRGERKRFIGRRLPLS